MNAFFSSFVRNISSRMPFYSVARGRKPGIYQTWPECEAQVKGFNKACFKKFTTRSEAEQHCESNGGPSFAGRAAGTSAQPPLAIAAKRPISTSTSVLSTGGGGGPAKRTKLIDLPVAGAAVSEIAQMKRYGELSFLEDKDGYVHVYTDGSCEGNGTSKAIAGLGVYFSEGHALNTSKPVSGRATNNCGEIQATSEAIRLARQHGIQKLCINTDSQFVINAVTKWLPGWIRKGWLLASGQPVKNVIDFKELHNLLQTHKDLKIKWTYVKAHCGILGNERADELAKRGGQMYKERMQAK